jgi:thiamine biosynthesis lipoprotein
LAVLRERGIRCALLDAGGDVVLGDPPPGKSGWTIGIAPLELKGKPSQYLSLANVAVATSGDMFQFVEIAGKRYSHIVDPRTGVGLTDHSKVTIVAPNGATGDSLATAVSVLGPEKGLALIESTPNTAALIMRAPDGKLTIRQSSRWKDVPIAHPEVKCN